MLRRLAFLSALVLFSACILRVAHPDGSTLSYLNSDLHLHIGEDSSMGMDHAWAALRAGQPVYETVFFGDRIKFQYPISSLLLYSAAGVAHLSGYRLNEMLAVLSFPATLLLGGEIFLLALPAGQSLSGRERGFTRVCVAVAGCVFFPLVLGLNLTQVQVLLTFLWALAVYLWLRGAVGWSGVCIGLICVFKPQLGLFAVWAVLRRRWRFLGPFLAVTVVAQALAIALFGWHNEIEYLAVLSYLSRHGEVFHANQSVNGLLQRFAGTGDPLHWEMNAFPPYNALVYSGTLVSTAILLGFGLLFPLGRAWRSTTADFVLFGMISTLASPIAWEHHYGSFFVAAMYVLARLKPQSGNLFAAMAGCFLVLACPLVSTPVSQAWTIVLSQDLFAGLGLVLLTILIADRESHANAGVRV